MFLYSRYEVPSIHWVYLNVWYLPVGLSTKMHLSNVRFSSLAPKKLLKYIILKQFNGLVYCLLDFFPCKFNIAGIMVIHISCKKVMSFMSYFHVVLSQLHETLLLDLVKIHSFFQAVHALLLLHSVFLSLRNCKHYCQALDIHCKWNTTS